MPAVVVPYRAAGKTRLPPELRADLARAMLEDVVAASLGFGPVVVVTDDPDAVPAEASMLADPGGGQGAAVSAALRGCTGQVLVVNADLPCATTEALHRLAAAGAALVAAVDGTTNALSLPDPSRFASLYGPGSAARFTSSGLLPVELPELVHDVDSVADLDRILLPLGPRTRLATDRYKARLASAR